MAQSESNGFATKDFPKGVVMAFGLKGGIGKTAVSTTVCIALKEIFDRVALLDADTVNQQLAELEEDVKVIDLRSTEIRGPLSNLAKKFKSGEIEAAVIDTPANLDPETFDEIIGWYRGDLAKSGLSLCVIMPITLSSFVQRKAAEFVEQHPTLPVVFVEMHTQGRKAAHFRRWRESKTLAKSLQNGTAATFMSDAGVEHGDEAAGFGLTIADVAQADFSKAGPYASQAAAIFNEDVQTHLAIWLDENIERLTKAIAQSVSHHATQSAQPAKAVA